MRSINEYDAILKGSETQKGGKKEMNSHLNVA